MRLIDAAETAEKISKAFGIPMHDLVDVFAEISTADVEIIKHGKWIWSSEHEFGNPYGSYKCSICNESSAFSEPYCCNCGAKMDADGESNDC